MFVVVDKGSAPTHRPSVAFCNVSVVGDCEAAICCACAWATATASATDLARFSESRGVAVAAVVAAAPEVDEEVVDVDAALETLRRKMSAKVVVLGKTKTNAAKTDRIQQEKNDGG